MATKSGDGDAQTEEQGQRRGVRAQADLACGREVLGTLPTGSLVDPGAGHGPFSQAAAHTGGKVVALDARHERFDATRW